MWLKGRLATRIAIGVIAVVLLLGFLQVRSCQQARQQAAQRKMDDAQRGALINSAQDAISTQGNVSSAAQASEELTARNREDIQNAKGADQGVDPAVRDAGLRSLCRRASFRDSPSGRARCAPAAGVAPARTPESEVENALGSETGHPGDVVYCGILQDRTTRDECAYFEQIWDGLELGHAGLDAPDEMTLGETATVSFVITRDSATASPSDLLGHQPDQAFRARVGRRMAALLQGEGFTIAPAHLRQQDLFTGDGARWDWRVTALRAPRHRLMLSVYVVVPGQRGAVQETLLRTVERPVPVRVTWGQWFQGAMEDSTAWFIRGTNWLKALGGLILALGGVWLAIKRFGKKDK